MTKTYNEMVDAHKRALKRNEVFSDERKMEHSVPNISEKLLELKAHFEGLRNRDIS